MAASFHNEELIRAHSHLHTCLRNVNDRRLLGAADAIPINSNCSGQAETHHHAGRGIPALRLSVQIGSGGPLEDTTTHTVAEEKIPRGRSRALACWYLPTTIRRSYPARPDRLTSTRPNVRPLSFRRGIHFCLGAQLAVSRAEVAIGHPVAAPSELAARQCREPESGGRPLSAGVA